MKESLLERQFGRLTVLAYAEPGLRGATRYLCQCACGNICTVARGELTRTRSDATRSCGCSRKGKAAWIKHGQAGHGTSTRTYRIWKGMITRCTNTNHHAYPRYGGRGIEVCQAWRTFENFFADMGECPPGLTIDRYPDKNGNYEPENCRWATYKEQANNTRRNLEYITFNGLTHTLSDWSILTGIAVQTLYYRRYKLEWTVEETLTIPVSKGRFRRARVPLVEAQESFDVLTSTGVVEESDAAD